MHEVQHLRFNKRVQLGGLAFEEDNPMNKHSMDMFDRRAGQPVEYRADKPNKRNVDVFGAGGGHVASFTVCLEDVACTDAEFEETAIILTEQSGRVMTAEFIHLHARCAE